MGWVSADDRDNDPAVLLAAIAVAVDRVEPIDPIDPTVFRALMSPAAAVTVPARLASAIAAMHRPVTLVVDHLEAVTNRTCLDAITQLALGLPAGSQLAIGSRDTPPLPAARLRAQGGILEIGVDDLAMDEHEAASLLEGAGIEPVDEHVRELVMRTEGWPVGLYLAALAMKAGSPYTDVGLTFTGEDRFVGDYLRSEFLDRLSPTEVSFLTRTSILDRMCGPLCDATLGRTRSSAVLEELEGRNLLVIPLDRHRDWYRYHRLFRELLAAELRRREPELVPRAAPPGRGVVRGQRQVGDRHRARAGRRRRRLRGSPGLAVGEPGVGEWAGRHRHALDGVVRDREPGRALPGGRRPRRPDVCVDGPAGGHRAVGCGRRAHGVQRIAPRRQHRRGHPRVPPGTPVPQGRRRHATRRADRLERAQHREPVSGDDAACRGPRPSPRRRRRPSRRDLRSCRRRGDRRRVSCPSYPSFSPSAASSPSNATTGLGRRSSQNRRSRSCRTAVSTITGRARSSTPGWPVSRCIAATSRKGGTTWREPFA